MDNSNGSGETLRRLTAEGRVKPATLELSELDYPEESLLPLSLSEALRELRADD